MIDFILSEDQRILIDMVRDFSATEIMPKAREYDEKKTFPQDVFEKASELGIVNCTLAAEYGGGNMGPVEAALIAEELGYACAGITAAIFMNTLGTAPINYFGSPEQKRQWLTRICKERLLVALALTEPQAGSDLAGLKTHFTKKSGSYVITGQKAWISNGNRADVYTVFAYPKGSQNLSDLSAFIVPGDAPGVIKGKPEDKLGLRASDTAVVSFEEVEIPQENLLVQEGSGFQISMFSLARGRSGTAAIATGIQQRCVDECLKYSRSRQLGGKSLGDHPVIRHYLAEMQMATETSRLAAWRAAWKAARGEDCSYEAALAKAYATSSAEKVTLMGVQIMGASGISLEYPVAKLVNDAKVLSIVEGTTEIQKNAISDFLYTKGRHSYFT